MKVRSILFVVFVCLVGLTLSFAADPSVGTWKLNESKSKVAAGAPKNNTIVIAAVGDNMKVTIDGVDGAGKPTHNEWTGKYDGKDYPVAGEANTVRSYKKVDDRTLEVAGKKDGKVIVSGKVTLSEDGKTRTVVASGTGADGKKYEVTAVYDKQ